jgi:hypothetical protein
METESRGAGQPSREEKEDFPLSRETGSTQ